MRPSAAMARGSASTYVPFSFDDLRFERGEPPVEFLRHLGEHTSVDRDARDLHAREDGDQRQLDVVKDASEGRALRETWRERVEEREGETGPGKEPLPPGFRREEVERDGRSASEILQGRHRLRREVQDLSLIHISE